LNEESSTSLLASSLLKAHWELMAAADFFTIEVPSPRGLVRYSVFFVIRLKTRTALKFLILDRDPLYTAAFRAMLDHCRVNSLRLPLHAVRT
jgi:putative transposase